MSCDLPTLCRAAALLRAMASPAVAAVLAQLPARPGVTMAESDLANRLGGVREFAGPVARLADLGVLVRDAGQVGLDHAALAALHQALVADSPLARFSGDPEIGPFIKDGRLTGYPVERGQRDRVISRLAELFEPGWTASEPELTAWLNTFVPDAAFLRRELVDTGHLQRDPGSADYRRPPVTA